MEPGQKLAEGIVVRHDKDGVWVGREVEMSEPLTPEYTEHFVGGKRVFLAKAQAAIAPAHLHVLKGAAASRRTSKKKGR